MVIQSGHRMVDSDRHAQHRLYAGAPAVKGKMMAAQPMTLHLPDDLYQQLKRQADQTQRTVEERLLEVLAAALPQPAELPADLAALAAQLAVLDDATLWQAARSRLDSDVAARIEGLHFKRQNEELDAKETQELAGLMHQYERAMLVRAQAAALLAQRGHDVSSLASGV